MNRSETLVLVEEHFLSHFFLNYIV